MQYHIVSIFPEIFKSFLETSLLHRANEDGKIMFSCVNPRDFCVDKHRQVDGEIYGGGQGMLLKAQPVIDAIKFIVKERSEETKKKRYKIILLGPSETVLNQSLCHDFVEKYTDIILLCGRYEGFDERVALWCIERFGAAFMKLSIGEYVLLGGEVAAMSVIEATARLIPGVIQQEISRRDESYRPEKGGKNLEYPQYTRPQDVEGYVIPKVLLSGHHIRIQERKEEQSTSV